MAEQDIAREVSEEEAAAEARKYADKVSAETVQDVIGKEEGIKGYFRNVETLKKYFSDICLIFPLLKDWTSGRYTKVPWAVIVSLVGAILYVLSPLDLCPDFIPVLGYVDDATVFGLSIAFARDFLDEYRSWRESQRPSD